MIYAKLLEFWKVITQVIRNGPCKVVVLVDSREAHLGGLHVCGGWSWPLVLVRSLQAAYPFSLVAGSLMGQAHYRFNIYERYDIHLDQDSYWQDY